MSQVSRYWVNTSTRESGLTCSWLLTMLMTREIFGCSIFSEPSSRSTSWNSSEATMAREALEPSSEEASSRSFSR